MERVKIERKSRVSPAEIAQEHLRGVGEPVIITDAIDNWPARSKWTFEFFKAKYGSDVATAWLGRGADAGKLTTLATYIDFLDTPSQELPGLWVGKDGSPLQAAPGQQTSPPYLLGWFAFRQHPELYDDIAPAPYFLLDLVSELNPTIREILEWTSQREYWAVYLGPANTLSALHRDYWNTHGYLSQIQGRKRAILFSPEDSDYLYGGRVDPEQPDLERFPMFDHATHYECVIEPGDTLLMPARWWHHVRGLDKSITVSHNFFDASNLTDHISHILRNLPTLAKALEFKPQWREQLRIKWRLTDFEDADGDTSK